MIAASAQLSSDPQRTTSPDIRDELFRYLRDAARHRLEIFPFDDDKRFVQNGGMIYYAVDTNVLSLYLAPGKMGPVGVEDADRGMGGFGVFFHDDPPAT